MGLQEHERRELAEIEQHLAEDDPQFGSELSSMKPAFFRLSRRAYFVLGLMTSYLIGLVGMICGVSTSSIVLVVLGAIITASFPSTVAVRAWSQRDR